MDQITGGNPATAEVSGKALIEVISAAVGSTFMQTTAMVEILNVLKSIDFNGTI